MLWIFSNASVLPTSLASLRRHRRTVGRVDHHPDGRSREVRGHVLGHPPPRDTKGLLGDITDVRGDDDVVERSEGVVRRERLTVEHIETSTPDVTGPQRFD